MSKTALNYYPRPQYGNATIFQTMTILSYNSVFGKPRG